MGAITARDHRNAWNSPPTPSSDTAGDTRTRLRSGGQTSLPRIIVAQLRSLYTLNWRVVLHPSGWQLWQLPLPAIVWLLTGDLLAVAWTVRGVISTDVSLVDLTHFGLFLLCATAYGVATSAAEARRRAADHDGEHVDHSSIWFFPAAAVLPAPLAVALVALVRAHRYLSARKPPHTYLFTTSAIVVSVLAVHTLAAGTPLHRWLVGAPIDAQQKRTAAAGLLAAIVAYYVTQAVLVGVARAVMTRPATQMVSRAGAEALVGDFRENAEIVLTLIVAAAGTIMLALQMLLLVLIVPPAIGLTVLVQHLRHLQWQRDHDAKTGVLSAEGFAARAQRALLRDTVAGRPTAIAMVDLDDLKRLNTELDHVGGDIVISTIAETLATLLRPDDLVGRFGGDEFAVLLPGTDLSEAQCAIERIRAKIAELRITVTTPLGGAPITLNSGDVPGCTISAGVAATHGAASNELEQINTGLIDLQRIASRCLLDAKHAGRNRVQVAIASDDQMLGAEIRRNCSAARGGMVRRQRDRHCETPREWSCPTGTRCSSTPGT